MRDVLVDVRCLQDPPFRERGIGRHARALLSRAREFLPGRRIVGLADAGDAGAAGRRAGVAR